MKTEMKHSSNSVKLNGMISFIHKYVRGKAEIRNKEFGILRIWSIQSQQATGIHCSTKLLLCHLTVRLHMWASTLFLYFCHMLAFHNSQYFEMWQNPTEKVLKFHDFQPLCHGTVVCSEWSAGVRGDFSASLLHIWMGNKATCVQATSCRETSVCIGVSMEWDHNQFHDDGSCQMYNELSELAIGI